MNTSNITNYKPKEFAELLGVSVKTLQRWDREGTLTGSGQVWPGSFSLQRESGSGS